MCPLERACWSQRAGSPMRRRDRRRASLFFWPSRPYNRDEPDVRRSEKPELLSYVAVSHVPPLALRTARMEEASCVSVCRSAEAPLSLSAHRQCNGAARFCDPRSNVVVMCVRDVSVHSDGRVCEVRTAVDVRCPVMRSVLVSLCDGVHGMCYVDCRVLCERLSAEW